MDTKWKSMVNKQTIVAIILFISGCAAMVLLYERSYFLETQTIWFRGIIVDMALLTGYSLLLRSCLNKKYQPWIPKDDTYYWEWHQEWRKQQRYIVIFASVAFAGACLYLHYLIQIRKMYYGYIANYAFAYLLIFTVLIFFCITEYIIIAFMKDKLGQMMQVVMEINQERLNVAIERERQSIERAAKSEQLKVDLISNVSHDLKTPLTSMVGYLELLKKEELDETARDYVDVISDKAEKLKLMIESLFSLAKASSGNIKMELEPIELNRLIEQLFADMETQVAESELQFVKLLTDEKTCFISDNLHMYRICQNLLENTLKYSAKGTRVFIKTYVEHTDSEDFVCLEMTNTAGYYMDFDKEDIIERFARGDKSRTSDGNGLGLAIVSTYTSALGGSFDIYIDCDQFKTKLTFPKGNLS